MKPTEPLIEMTLRAPKTLVKTVKHIAVDQDKSLNRILVEQLQRFVQETGAATGGQEAA